MFAQILKFQIESEQNNEEKLLQLQKENEERILENKEKQRRLFLELQKQQEALFKRLSNNQLTDTPTIFTQNAVWNALETFSTHQLRIRPLRRITEDMKISILPTVPIELMQKSPATYTKARNCGTQVRRLYLTKNLKNLAF